MRKTKLSRTADVIEYGLAREVLHRCGYGAVREGDYLKVYAHSVGSSLYVNEKDRDECEWRCDIYVDEGFQHDCLTSDGLTGMNKPWMEMCSMNELLKLIVLKLEPDYKFESSPFIGRGWTARHYHEQYVTALDKLLETSELAERFDWPHLEIDTDDIQVLQEETA